MNFSTFQQSIHTHASEWVREQLARNPDLLSFTQTAELAWTSNKGFIPLLAVRKTLLNHQYAVLHPKENTLYFRSPQTLGELVFSSSEPQTNQVVGHLTLHATQPRQSDLTLRMLQRVGKRKSRTVEGVVYTSLCKT
jgi:hypothetical protein